MLELKENRVWRPFVGGKLLDEFAGKCDGVDGHTPERWICSTTSAGDDSGISSTIDGVPITHYVKEPLDILVKLLDSYTRLMIQVHPDDAYAQKCYQSQYGKTEAWYILETREILGEKPYVFLGFKEGVTREQWQDVFEKQDISAMEACLHKIPVKAGDVFFIPGKVPHAMGSGVFFAEVQQPTDITLRTERLSPDGREMAEEGLYYTGTKEQMLDCFDYDGGSLREILSRYQVMPQGEMVLDTPLFSMQEITLQTGESRVIQANPYAIVVVLSGEKKGHEFFLQEEQSFTGPQKLLVCRGNAER